MQLVAGKKRISASFYCLLALIATLLSLAFVPDLLKKRKFTFDTGIPAAAAVTFPIDTLLPEVVGGKTGKALNLKALAAQSPSGILVNFWATWCPPCLEELPTLEHLHRQLSKAGTALPQLVTISVDEKPEDVATLYKTLDFKPSFLVLYDRDGALSRSVGTTKFPETYWINKDGKILHKWIGPQNWIGAEVLRKLGNL